MYSSLNFGNVFFCLCTDFRDVGLLKQNLHLFLLAFLFIKIQPNIATYFFINENPNAKNISAMFFNFLMF